MEQQKQTKKVKQIIILIIISCVLIVVVGLSQLQNYIYQYGLNKKVIVLANELAELKQASTTQQSSVAENAARLQQLEKWHDLAYADTIIPEVAYLIKMADINLRLNGDISHAIILLTIADDRASHLPQAKYFALRKALANDLETLKTAPKSAIIGTVLRINALNTQLAALAEAPTMLAQTGLSTAAVQPETTGTVWHRFWQTTLKYLRNIILIERNPTAETPLPTVSERQYLINYIELNLLQAKWAVFQHNSMLYKISLQEIQQPISLVFAHNLAVKQQILLELESLTQTDINPPIPNIDNSLKVSQQMLEQLFSKDISS